MGFEAKTGLGKVHEFGADMASTSASLDGDAKAFCRALGAVTTGRVHSVFFEHHLQVS